MSIFVELMIGGWTLAIAMIGFVALYESGNLLKIRKRMATWLESSAAPVALREKGLQRNDEDAA